MLMKHPVSIMITVQLSVQEVPDKPGGVPQHSGQANDDLSERAKEQQLRDLPQLTKDWPALDTRSLLQHPRAGRGRGQSLLQHQASTSEEEDHTTES